MKTIRFNFDNLLNKDLLKKIVNAFNSFIGYENCDLEISYIHNSITIYNVDFNNYNINLDFYLFVSNKIRKFGLETEIDIEFEDQNSPIM